MLKTILLPLTLSFSSVTYGSCLLDSPEIGDIGPGSQLCVNCWNHGFHSWILRYSIERSTRTIPSR